YSAIHERPDYTWPEGKRLALYIGLNLEHFSFGEGLGACLAPAQPQPDVLNYSWREYGNRVGACTQRGHEIVGHGHSNAERQGTLDEAQELALLKDCRERFVAAGYGAPA